MEGTLDTELLQSLLQTKWLGRMVCYEKEVDSTNIRAKALAAGGAKEGTLAVAERQSAGRGRLGRSWQTDAGEAVSMSFLSYPSCQPWQASMLSLVTGLSVAQGLREFGVAAFVKWPNDVVAGGRKLCGILTEMQADTRGIRYVVVGIGINVNQETMPEKLREKATSLYLETGEKKRREAVMACVLNRLEENYEGFLKAGDLSFLKEEYERLLVNCGKQVRVERRGEAFLGTACGIRETGELLVKREDGRMEEIGSGEVSVRGLYGYV